MGWGVRRSETEPAEKIARIHIAVWMPEDISSRECARQRRELDSTDVFGGWNVATVEFTALTDGMQPACYLGVAGRLC
ncbi:MAG: hypothetical protein ACRDS1_03665 [Pseudonocardiaceae bacterium]